MVFMKKIIIFITLVFFYINNVNSQNFSLDFTKEGDSQKKLQYKSYENLILSVDDSINSLKEKGYIDASVNRFVQIDSLNYRIELNTGLKLKHVEITNIENLEDGVQLIYKKNSKNGLISFEKLQELIDSSVKYFSNKGYPFASLKLDKVRKVDSLTLKSELLIDLGSKREITKVVVKGYENFPKKFIKNLMGLKSGSELKIDEIRNQMSLINRTNFARSIKDPEILFTNDSTEVFLYLKKVKKNTFDGFIGFNTNEENGKLEIQGYAKINLINTFNQGEEIKIDFLSEDSQDRFLNSQVRMPFIFNSPLSLNTGLKLIQKDSIYNSRDFFVDLELLKKQFRGGLGYEKTESVNEIPFQNVEAFKKNIINLFISYELLDPDDSFEFYNFRFFLKAGIGEKDQMDEKNKVGKFKIEMTKKFEISEKLKINSRFLSEKLDSQNLVTNELLRFGGIESIRGFDQNSIFTNNYKLLNTSVNFYLNDTIYIYTLFDVANYQNKILSIDEFIYSGGFGFSSLTKNGLISVNYAKGNTWGNSFKLKNAKLSVSFVTFF